MRRARGGERRRRVPVVLLAVLLGAVLCAGCSGSSPGGGPASSGAQSSGASSSGASSAAVSSSSAPAPYRDATLPVAARVADLLGRMTTPEKIGQVTQAERSDAEADPSLVHDRYLGSLLSGGGSGPDAGTPQAWAAMVDGFQRQALSTPLGIPLLYGVDSVHGHGNLRGATVFPHNIGLGATADPALVEEVEHATASETRATGPQWTFAPCLCVARDDRWGRTYESFSEDPALVERLETAIDGLQGPPGHLADPDRVLATAKHYAGDGDTRYDAPGGGTPGYRLDQGVAITSRADFARVALAPYTAAVRTHHVGSVMPSFSSVDWTEDGVGNPVKLHASTELITGHLKGELGFDGLVVSDWLGVHQLPDPADPRGNGLTAAKVRAGANAGIDLFMEPGNAPQFDELLAAEVAAGRVPTARLDDAVRRVLTVKFRLGLFEHPYTDPARLAEVGSAAHRALARRAVAASQVLLRNQGAALPLAPTGRIYVAGSNADDLGHQAGGWTVTWQGGTGATFPGTTILAGIRAAAPGATVTFSADASASPAGYDTGIVVVGESSYAEGYGDIGGPRWSGDPADGGVERPEQTLKLSGADVTAIDRVCAAVRTCVVAVVSGRPLELGAAQLAAADALVASWLPGSEGAGVADVLFGVRPFTGKLPMSWPRSIAQEPINVGDARYDPLFAVGSGLSTAPR